jgi:hypothetical protein
MFGMSVSFNYELFIEVKLIVGVHVPSSTSTTCQFNTSPWQFRVTLQYGYIAASIYVSY